MANRKLNSEHKKELREFLQNTSGGFQQYHLRKENLAWVATTVYLSGILGLNSLLIDNGKVIALSMTLKWGFSIIILVTFFVTLAFIAKQHSDRTIAAHIVASCYEVLGQLLDPNFVLQEKHLKMCEYKERGQSFHYPKILVERLKSERRRPYRILWNYISPYLAVIIWTAASITFIVTS